MNEKIILTITAISLLLLPFIANAQQCGDGELDPGEYCDKSAGGDRTSVVWFDNIDSCNKVNPDWQDIQEQGLDCFEAGSTGGQPCQLDVSGCEDTSDDGPGGRSCPACDECDERGSFNDETCTQRECSYQCPAFGNCYYTPGFGEDCTDCVDNVNRCEDYENEFDCNANVCASSDNMGSRVCEWIGGRCRENLDCTWDCDRLYDTDPDEDGFCQKQIPDHQDSEGDHYTGCELIDWINKDQSDSRSYEQECLARNPADNYPDQIICKELQENFPVFTNINVILTIILLIGYYTISIKRKNKYL